MFVLEVLLGAFDSGEFSIFLLTFFPVHHFIKRGDLITVIMTVLETEMNTTFARALISVVTAFVWLFLWVIDCNAQWWRLFGSIVVPVFSSILESILSS